MGSSNEIQKKIINKRMNDSLSINSVDYKLKLENASSYQDNINNTLSSHIQSDTRESTKVSELKEETFPYKFIWNKGGKSVKIAGTFLDNWRIEKELKKNINSGLFEIIINLTRAKHEFKFIVDNKWLCSQSYEIIKDKNNYNNIIDLTNQSYISDSQKIDEQRKIRKRKLSLQYGSLYPKESDFDKEVPSLPIFFIKSFNLDKRNKRNNLRKKSISFLDYNLNKNDFENKAYKIISTISHDKISHLCCQAGNDYKININNYTNTAITQRNNHKFLTLIYYTPIKTNH